MVKSLKELGVPDYSEEEWFALDDLTKFIETLTLRCDGETLESPVDPEVLSIYIETFERDERANEDRNGLGFFKDRSIYNLFDGWHETLQAVRTRKDLFEFLQRADALDQFIYRSRRDVNPAARPYFTNNFYQYFGTARGRRESIDFWKKRSGSGSIKEIDKEEAKKKLEALRTLDGMIKSDGLRPLTELSLTDSCFARDRFIFPYHIVLRREYGATREILDA